MFKPQISETRIPDAYKTSIMAKSRMFIGVGSSPALATIASKTICVCE